jgi:aminoglycoside phosphotransferase (APT) family kinase protein
MRERLAAAFDAAFPRARSARLDRMRPIQQEPGLELWRCRVRWLEPDGRGEADLAVRVGSTAAGVAACRREVRALKLAAERGLRVPEVWLASGEDEVPAFVAVEWIEGEPFSLAWRRRRPDASAETLAGVLVELHERTERVAGTAVDEVGEALARLSRLAEERADEAARLGVAGLAAGRPAPAPVVLCHGDYRPEKVLLDGNGTPWLVGWTRAGYGDPRLDLATAVVWLDDRYGAALRAPFLRIYRRTRPVEPADLAWFERLVRLDRRLSHISAAT